MKAILSRYRRLRAAAIAKATENAGHRRTQLERYPGAHPGYLASWPVDWRLCARQAFRDIERRRRGSHLLNPAFECDAIGKRARWIEDTERAGLMHEGHADEIDRSIDHRGWYCGDDNLTGEIARGAVYSVNAGKRGRVYLYAVDDPCNPGAALMAWQGMQTIKQPGDFAQRHRDAEHDEEQAKRDAASWADSIAARYAEREREYYAAWQLGREQADATQDAKTLAGNLRRLLAEMRARRGQDTGDAPEICNALRQTARRMFHDMHATRNRRDEIARDSQSFNDNQAAAYRDALAG